MKGHRDRQSGLTAGEERFCLELIKPGTSQSEAYRCAFPKSRKWAAKTVWARASELAKESKVRGRVRELMDQVAAVGIIDAKESMLLLSRVARADLRKCYREDGTLKAPHEIDDETAAGLMGFETVGRVPGEGERAKAHGVRTQGEAHQPGGRAR